MAIKSPGDDAKALALIHKQIEDGDRFLNADHRAKRPRLSPTAHAYAAKFFQANQLGKGPRPSNATDTELIRELIETGVLLREGHGRGTTYTLQFRPVDIFVDETKFAKVKTKRRMSRSVSTNSELTSKSVITIGASEREILRKGIHEYLSFATSTEARKHEERRQSETILDQINARAKELLRKSKRDNSPRLTPMDAMRQAQAEVAVDFETLLQLRFDPVFYAVFGISESSDTSMKTIRT